MAAWTIYISFIGAAVLALQPRAGAQFCRVTALATTVASCMVASLACLRPHAGELQIISKAEWIPSLGIHFLLAADGVSLLLLLLTGIASVAGVLFSWNIEHRPSEFFALYLALIGGVYGVFLSYDLFLLFVFYELAIIPKYFLIAIWGSTNRQYGAMKLALYSFVGSALVLIGIIAAYIQAGGHSTSLLDLSRYPYERGFQMWVFPLVFLGFAILAGLWPFHSWAPTGHVAAPTAASMLLAGVVMKLGAYGCLRVALPLFPEGLGPWTTSLLGLHSWRDVFALLGTVGIVYGAMVALVQRDFKFVIGYSSVSHMGFVLLGLMTLNNAGLTGAVLQMFSHGIIAGLLFAVVGRVLYDRTHTRDLGELQAMNLHASAPFATVTFFIAGVASMGLPGFSGFVAELHVLLGAWRAYPKLTMAAGCGILLAVVYTLRATQKGFFRDGPPAESVSQAPLPPVTLPEKLGALLLIFFTLAAGLYPSWFIRLITPALQSDLFAGLRKVAGI